MGRQSISEDQIAYMKLNNSGNVGDIIEEEVEDIVLRTSKKTSEEIQYNRNIINGSEVSRHTSTK